MFSTSKEGVMKLNEMIGKDRAGKTFPLPLGWAFSIGGLATALLLALSPILYAQSSPLTVQPSTGRVGVTTDDPGGRCQLNEYDPWGSVSNQVGNCDPTHKFTGKELDPETGLYYYGGRYYDPEISRFISPDPFVAQPGNPQG